MIALSDRDSGRLQNLLREADRKLKNLHPVYRRRTISVTSGYGIRNAYVNGDVSTDDVQSCYLDTDGTGQLIDVNCTICGGSSLSSAIPRLADGILLPVYYDGTCWRSAVVFQATEDCE